MHQYVGQEPSGRNFNELILDYNKKPHNPMINAGAIITCSLLKTLIKPEMTLAEKFDYTLAYFQVCIGLLGKMRNVKKFISRFENCFFLHFSQRMSGGDSFGFNNAVFLSEREAADRNYALGFYMRENKCFPDRCNLRECMDFYFQVFLGGFFLKILQ